MLSLSKSDGLTFFICQQHLIAKQYAQFQRIQLDSKWIIGEDRSIMRKVLLKDNVFRSKTTSESLIAANTSLKIKYTF